MPIPQYVCCWLQGPDDRWLIEQRDAARRHAAGQRTCFGGAVEPEKVRAAITRELNEELGVRCDALAIACDLFVDDADGTFYWRRVPADGGATALSAQPRRLAEQQRP